MLDTLRTLLTTLAGDRVHSAGESDDREPTTLYRCPDCERVYVAVEKAECADCATAVEPVDRSAGES